MSMMDQRWIGNHAGLLAIDGIDGSGKSTVARGVATALTARGIRANMADRSGVTAQASVAAMTAVIKRSDGRLERLDPRAEALLRGARAWQRLAAREPGGVLILDRWLISDLGRLGEDAYRSHRPVFEEIVQAASDGPTILLEAPFEVTWSRVSARPRHELSPKEQLGVEENKNIYDEIAAGSKRFVECGGEIQHIDATQPVEQVIANAMAVLCQRDGCHSADFAETLEGGIPHGSDQATHSDR